LTVSATFRFFPPLRVREYRERWSPFKVEGDGGCSKKNFFASFFEERI